MAKDAVVGVVAGGARVGREEEDHLLSRKTTDFSSEIRSRLKGLGVVKSAPSGGSIMRAIDDGIQVSDLVDRVSKPFLKEDVYESEADGMERNANVRAAMAAQTPDYLRSRRSLVRHLMAKGLTEEEAQKRADAQFGPGRGS